MQIIVLPSVYRINYRVIVKVRAFKPIGIHLVMDYMKYDFYVVAIGSSAGGMKPLKELFSILPNGANACFVLVSHLLAGSRSTLNEILSKCTEKPVKRATHGTVLQAGEVYVLPEGKMMVLKNGVLELRERRPDEIINRAIDIFFRSLADDAGEKAIAVILSGGGNDGLQGVYHISDRGGLVIVQEPCTADVSFLPDTIIAEDHPDYVLSPKKIREKILEKTGTVKEPVSGD